MALIYFICQNVFRFCCRTVWKLATLAYVFADHRSTKITANPRFYYPFLPWLLLRAPISPAARTTRSGGTVPAARQPVRIGSRWANKVLLFFSISINFVYSWLQIHISFLFLYMVTLLLINSVQICIRMCKRAACQCKIGFYRATNDDCVTAGQCDKEAPGGTNQILSFPTSVCLSERRNFPVICDSFVIANHLQITWRWRMTHPMSPGPIATSEYEKDRSLLQPWTWTLTAINMFSEITRNIFFASPTEKYCESCAQSRVRSIVLRWELKGLKISLCPWISVSNLRSRC